MSFWCRWFGIGCPPPEPDPGEGNSPQGELAAQCVEAHNEIRQGLQLPLFELHECAANQSQKWAEAMAKAGRISHDGFGVRVDACGLAYAGENVAAGYATGQSVTEGWMGSSGHRANIVKAAFTKIGVGYFYVPNDPARYGHYFAAIYTR